MAVIKIEAKKDTRCMQTICLIRGDRRTQILRFGVNRFDGGVDLSDLTWVIKTANAKGVEDVFEPEAVEIGENRITVDWLVDGSVTDADGMAKYELNGLDATEDGKGIVWKGGMGTMSLRADIGENFADIDMTNVDRLVLYVEGRLQHIIDLTDELQNAGETANAAATAANAGAVRAEAAAIAANTGATAATEAASNASAAAEAANTAALPHAQLYGMRVRGETAKASGNPVTFLPDAGSLLQPVTVLDVQQAGSGEPYPAGGGRNLLSEIGIVGDIFLKALVRLEAGKTYTLSVQKTPDALYFSNEGGSVDYAANTGSTSLTYTAETTGGYSVLARFGTGASVDFGMMLEEGATASEYQPYSNIRPIIGYDKLGLNAAGKNLLEFIPELTQYNTGDTRFFYRVNGIPGGTYYLKCSNAGAYAHDYRSFILYDENRETQLLQVPYVLDGEIQVANAADARYAMILVQVPNADIGTVQLEFGSIATPFAPYQSKLHTVQIGQTVCGGKFDWLTGKLMDGIPLIEFDGDEVASPDEEGVFTTSAFGAASAAYGEMWCSHYTAVRDYGAFMNTDMSVCVWASGQIRIHDSRFKSVSEINAYYAAQMAAGTPVQIAYKLATPIEIQLTPHIISAVEPEQNNTLYGDGTIEVEYVKPLHVSIEERVAAALAAAAE